MSRFVIQCACAIVLAAVCHFGVAAQDRPFYTPPAYPFYTPPNRPFYTPPSYPFYAPPTYSFYPGNGPRYSVQASPIYAYSEAPPQSPPKQVFVAPAPTVANDYAEIRVLVPDPQARIWFDGSSTTQRGKDRLFYTPTLKMDATPSYQIRATWMQGAKEVSQSRVVRVAPGQTTVVDFK